MFYLVVKLGASTEENMTTVLVFYLITNFLEIDMMNRVKDCKELLIDTNMFFCKLTDCNSDLTIVCFRLPASSRRSAVLPEFVLFCLETNFLDISHF